jgi:hypothetical protein
LRSRRAIILALIPLAAALISGCSPDSQPAAAASLKPQWRQLTLPVPDGQRIAPRDAVRCGERWYLVGALVGPTGATKPAVWASPDATDWTALTLQPLSFYGEQNILYAVGCRDGKIAMIGAKTGGAHGNPRVSTWFQRPDGSFLEVVDSLEQYGGNEGVNAARIVGGSLGWLIVGNRTNGASVWLSPDATRFDRYDNRPNLAGDSTVRTTAVDGVATGDGWLLVGGLLRSGQSGRDPVTWTSTNGRDWLRQTPAAAAEDESLMRVIGLDDGHLAAGVRGSAFGVWRESGGTWRADGRFGVATGNVAAGVDGMTVAGGRHLVATQASAGHLLWAGEKAGENAERNAERSWIPVELPVTLPAGGTTAVAIAGAGDTLLVGADDGQRGSIWLANITD